MSPHRRPPILGVHAWYPVSVPNTNTLPQLLPQPHHRPCARCRRSTRHRSILATAAFTDSCKLQYLKSLAQSSPQLTSQKSTQPSLCSSTCNIYTCCFSALLHPFHELGRVMCTFPSLLYAYDSLCPYRLSFYNITRSILHIPYIRVRACTFTQHPRSMNSLSSYLSSFTILLYVTPHSFMTDLAAPLRNLPIVQCACAYNSYNRCRSYDAAFTGHEPPQATAPPAGHVPPTAIAPPDGHSATCRLKSQ